MHLCAAQCCSDELSSINEVMACKERCEAPLMRAQKYVQSELERYQESLQRCVLSCQDDIKDKGHLISKCSFGVFKSPKKTKLLTGFLS